VRSTEAEDSRRERDVDAQQFRERFEVTHVCRGHTPVGRIVTRRFKIRLFQNKYELLKSDGDFLNRPVCEYLCTSNTTG